MQSLHYLKYYVCAVLLIESEYGDFILAPIEIKAMAKFYFHICSLLLFSSRLSPASELLTGASMGVPANSLQLAWNGNILKRFI
jgi:hypothetical protein